MAFHSAANTHNVVSFGADPSGVSDSQAAIQSAYDAALPGDTVYFPSGNYRIGTAFLPYYRFIIRSDITLLGEAANAVTLRMDLPPAGEQNRLFTTDTDVITQNARFKNLVFVNATFAIRLEETMGCSITHCSFSNATVYVFATLEDGNHGNTDVTITHCTFDNPDYRSLANNPNYDPAAVYTPEDLNQFNYWNQFLIRIMTYPWIPGQPGTARNQNIVVDSCFFRGGCYNAVEVAGDRNTHVLISNSNFTENYGVAIDFDKGAQYCTALNNVIEDMKPTQQYASDIGQVDLYLQAVSCQNGGDVDMASTNNVFIGNTFFQSTLPYRKIRLRDGFACTIQGNTVLPGDADDKALSITYTDFRSGSALDSTWVQGNDFGTGNIVLGGSFGGPAIEEPLLFRGNTFNGQLEIYSKHWRSIDFSAQNVFLFNDTIDDPTNVASISEIDHLRFNETIFIGDKALTLYDVADTLTFYDCTFDSLQQLNVRYHARLVMEGNRFNAFSRDTAVYLQCDTVFFRHNTFCGNEGQQLLVVEECAALDVQGTNEGNNVSNAHAITNSTIVQEADNYWQGVNAALCGPLGSTAADGPVMEEWSVWPNPFTESFTLRGLAPSPTVTVLDALGRTIHSGKTTSELGHGWNAGTYTVIVQDGSTRHALKLVKTCDR